MSIQLGGKLKSWGVPRVISRQLPRILLLSVLLAFSLSASPILQYQVTTNGTTGTYHYFVSGFDFLANEELDIQFGQLGSSNLFGSLSNGKAPTGFDLMLFQPNNPPQAPGDYSAMALVNHPSLAGTFSVDFTLTGTGLPGSQAFSISQFDSNGNFVSLLASGNTQLEGSGAPEPASFLPCGVALIIAGIFWARRAFA
jgi:hypothetical protein